MKHLYTIIVLLSFACLVFSKGKYNEKIFNTENKFIYDACISANGRVIVCTDNTALKAFSVQNRTLLGTFSGGHRNKILCVAMSSDSAMVASGGSDSTVVIWDYNTHTVMQRITFAGGKITSIRFSPDNQFILFGCSNSPAYLYSIKEQKKIHEFTDQEMDVTSVAFSQTGSLIAIAGGDKKIRLYNTTDFQLKSELKGHTDWVRSICFYNDGQNLISCGDDKRIIQWNLSRRNSRTVNMIFKGWTLCIDIENEAYNKSNMYVVGTMNGSVTINYILGLYKAKLNCPISKVIILPNKSGFIEIAIATLGSGLMHLSAADM